MFKRKTSPKRSSHQRLSPPSRNPTLRRSINPHITNTRKTKRRIPKPKMKRRATMIIRNQRRSQILRTLSWRRCSQTVNSVNHTNSDRVTCHAFVNMDLSRLLFCASIGSSHVYEAFPHIRLTVRVCDWPIKTTFCEDFDNITTN